MDLRAGDISLDFVNTASDRTAAGLKEKLREYGDLVTWAERVEVAGPDRAKRLRRAAAASPAEAEAVLKRARVLREAIYRIFAGGAPAESDLAVVGEAAGRAAAERRLVAAGAGYRFAWPEGDRLDQILWPVALSAAELLTSEDRARVKACASETCDWLFLDMSRNRSRRWCDMEVCGNRAKARRFNERQKRASS